jgi:hypothetical protein
MRYAGDRVRSGRRADNPNLDQPSAMIAPMAAPRARHRAWPRALQAGGRFQVDTKRLPMPTRRQFIQLVPAASLGLGIAAQVHAQAALVDPASAQAVALGYAADAAKVDGAKYKQYKAGQACSSCALYQGKASDASAPCALFPGKQVAGKGWCSAYAKKA